MQLLLCNDLHLTSYQPVSRSDDILKTSLRKLDEILDLAKRYGARILIGGDMFDRPRDWGLLSGVVQLLTDYVLRYKAARPLVVRGQHDMYMRSAGSADATTMGVLESAGLIEILTSEQRFLGCFHERYGEGSSHYAYGCNWGETIPQPVEFDYGYHILVIHAPISDKRVYLGQSYMDARNFLKTYDYDLILCGDAHRRFDIFIRGAKPKTIVNTGPILRIKADNYNMRLRPSVALFETETNTLTWKPLSLQEGVFKTDQIERSKEQDLILSEFIEAVQSPNIGIGTPMIERVREWARCNDDHRELIDLLEKICGVSLS
jgi:DNA repair exonuclease SbcCD nuclease subunit